MYLKFPCKKHTLWITEEIIQTQTDGTTIGPLVSGDIAAIYMEFYENEYVFNSNKNSSIPIFWAREVDDVYCLWQHGYENIPIFLHTSTAFIQGLNGQ